MPGHRAAAAGRIMVGPADDRRPEGGRAAPAINLNFGLCVGNSGSWGTLATWFVGKGSRIPQGEGMGGGKGRGWRFSQRRGVL